ncbi:TetR family transcriptional regulator [Subtercola boreus]|uniref:TetR family transcriptional regulator n=1 Tax=Subtercola boreus TaxID=120213 RepID=A0A3E0VN28_9MICO|nr:TetR family transcriptional regulator [Subtercola boreus]RFA10823.1 TetR family transcriptional regulator [Subtercola boreus]TQL55599.1 TetR family transcriptional regulator [Subtercola boreus]
MTSPHGSDPEQQPRQARHTRDDVAETALRILDDHGLPELTMRRLAAALDVQPSALYWHFPNKQTLLAELSDRIASRGRALPFAPVTPGDWMIVTAAEAQSLRDALLAYRDGAEVVSSSFALGLGASVPLTRLRAAIGRGEFDAETVSRASAALLHFILGHVSHEQQRLQYDSLGVAAGPESDEGTSAFEFGVLLFIEGLAQHAASRSTTR